MAFIIAAGFYTFGGLELIQGQVTPAVDPDFSIRISAIGLDPDSITVRPGDIIEWVNDQQIPHVLSSETLPTESGRPFETHALFNADTFIYTIPQNAISGTHEYISETSEDIVGEIIIIGADAQGSVSSAPILEAMSSASSITAVSHTSSIDSSPLPAGILAVNPYVIGTVGSVNTGGSTSRAPVVTQHKPVTNTNSGPAVWIAFAASTAGLFYITRKAFQKA